MSETLEKPGAERDAGFAKAEGTPISALVQLRQSSAWKWATPAQREVLQRIAALPLVGPDRAGVRPGVAGPA